MVLLLGFLFAAGIVSFAKLNASNFLPPGVRIEKIYDRTELIDATTSTVLHNMILGIVLIFFVQWLFLGDLRSAVIGATTIPFALFFAVTIPVLRGQSANLLSVGAIDFGLVVDATVIMVENIFRHLRAGPADEALAPVGIARAAGLGGKLRTIFRAAVEVNRAIFFSAAIIIAGFCAAVHFVRGRRPHFGPMAKTYAYAIAGATALAFDSLGAPGNVFWTLAGNVTQTIFDAGTLLHRQRAAEAAFDQAAAQYQSTVIAALQNVADSSRALQSDADALSAAAAAQRAASASLEITRRQLQLGGVNYLSLLTAESAYQQGLSSMVQAQASRYADTAALFQALGGGWWNRADYLSGRRAMLGNME